jgi:hypothetical protein
MPRITSRALVAFPKNEKNYGSVASSTHFSCVRETVKIEHERVKLKNVHC